MAKPCRTCAEWKRLYEILQAENERNKEAARELSLKLDKIMDNETEEQRFTREAIEQQV